VLRLFIPVSLVVGRYSGETWDTSINYFPLLVHSSVHKPLLSYLENGMRWSLSIHYFPLLVTLTSILIML